MATSSEQNFDSEEQLDQWLSQRKREREEEIRRVESVVAKDSNERKLTLENFLDSTQNLTQSTNTQSQNSEYVLEVDYLIQRRPVTSLSAAFIRQLERALFNNQRVQSANQLNGRQERHSSPAPQPAIPTPPPLPPILGRSQIQPSPPASAISDESIPSSASDYIRPPLQPRVERLVDPDAVFRDNSRDEFVQEVSQLIAQHHVANTLESDFRNILETSLQHHLDRIQVDVRPALEALSRLPPSGHRRNDFRDLGIIPPEDQGLDEDTVSIISATARAVPPDQRTSVLAKEVSNLRKEMLEMKTTLSMLFEAQMETQRCIRQELSSALSISQSQSSCMMNQSPSQQLMRNPGNKCLICLTQPSDTILYRCGHLCMCYQCSLQLQSHQNQATCPVCRAPVVDTLRVYVPAGN